MNLDKNTKDIPFLELAGEVFDGQMVVMFRVCDYDTRQKSPFIHHFLAGFESALGGVMKKRREYLY